MKTREEQIEQLKLDLFYWGNMNYKEGCEMAQEILLRYDIMGLIENKNDDPEIRLITKETVDKYLKHEK